MAGAFNKSVRVAQLDRVSPAKGVVVGSSPTSHSCFNASPIPSFAFAFHLKLFLLRSSSPSFDSTKLNLFCFLQS